MHADIQYARSGDVAIAYTVVGDQPLDLIYVHGSVGHLELERPELQAMLARLATYARVITFDLRGTGLSDRVRDVPTLETRMDDVRAVLDAVGSKRAVAFGTFEAGAMVSLFAATYPGRRRCAGPRQSGRPRHLGSRLPVGRHGRRVATNAGRRRRPLGEHRAGRRAPPRARTIARR